MPFVEVFTREKLSDDIRSKLAEELSNTIIAPQGLMNTELKSRAVKEVARILKAALGVGREENDTGIFTMCIEIDDGQWAVGAKIPTLCQLLDKLGGNVSEQRRAEMSARYPQKR
jgi:hypothetical protein